MIFAEGEMPEVGMLLENGRNTQMAAAARTTDIRAELPLRYLSQQAHLTAPASEFKLAEKALANAYSVAARLMTRYEITPYDLADRLGVPEDAVVQLIERGRTPLILIDLEDGVAPQMIAQARSNAIELVRNVDRGSSLCFLRPAGITDPRCTDDLVELLTRAGTGLAAEQYPIDGIVFPKVRHVHEVEWLDHLLSAIEDAMGLQRNRIRVSFQIETGWGILNLPQLAIAARARLAGVILGTVDLSADLMLPSVRYRHPVCEWARTVIVATAGSLQVPAIDGMTLDFPVGRAGASASENHELVLQRMASNFADTLHSIDHGLAGRWVGHPLQLLATTLAFGSAFSASTVDARVNDLETFATALAANKGASAGGKGELHDIATDRHLRQLLRRDTAWGLLSPQRARELGLITEFEMAAMRA
jgi:citrate lyase beta subunit